MSRLVLDLGSDSTYCEDYTTLDIVHLKGEKYVVCDLTKGIPFEDNCVDAVVSNHFIEHISLNKSVELFKEILRVLKPQAVFTVATPDMESLIKKYVDGKIGYVDFVAALYNDDDDQERMQHKNIFDFKSLKNILETIGFINVKQVFLGSGDLKPWRDIKLYPPDGTYKNVKQEADAFKTFQLRCEKA